MTTKLSRQATSLWAKKRSTDGQRYWLPLVVHLIDTQNTINWLFNNWLCEAQQQILCGTLSAEASQKLVKLVGFIHDIGKATPAFQTKQSFNGDKSLDDDLETVLSHTGFTKLNDLHLESARESPHTVAGEALLDEFGLPDSIGAIIGGHHGKPASYRPYEQIDNYTANYFQDDTNSVLQAPWRQVQKELLYYGLDSSGYQSVTEVPSVTQPQAVILEGLLIMADWLASGEYLDAAQTRPLFPLISLDQTFKDIKLKDRFQLAMSNWDTEGTWIPNRVDNDFKDDNPYEDRWHFEPRPVQKTMTQAIGATVDPGMAIIEAPMGLGKTEIALLAAEQLAYITGRDGLFMGLPTQATTNAMFDRVEEWVDYLAGAQQQSFGIKLMHSKAQFNKKYRALPNVVTIYDHDDQAGTVGVNDWFSGKKSILTKFTVGTIDHLLLMGLKQKHLFLRHLGLSGKIVIIDEVHAYDAYMNQYLYKALNWLGAYHVPIIILSATLPKAKRNELLKAYLMGKYGRKFERSLTAPTNWEETQAYPLLSLIDGNQIKQITKFDGHSQALTKVNIQRLVADDDALIASIVNQIQHGGVAGIIVNTVKRAQKLAQLVPTEIRLMLLHSAFLATDRSTQEEQLQAAIGKRGKRPEKLIVIGTQVLEQSLDIDFDVLYTDIAPMDLLLQRMGRLHRHQLVRPQALQTPQVFIMGIQGPAEYEQGSQKVYGQYLLMKTDHFLSTTINLPTDISPLVQKVYDPATDNEVRGIAAAKEAFMINLKQEVQKAQAFQIDEPCLDDDETLHGWLDRDLNDVSQNDQQASAAVRDIKETLEVILVQHTNKGNFLINGKSLEEVKPRVIAQQIIRLPVAITPNIEKAIEALEDLTSAYFSSWQTNYWLKGALALPLDENLTTHFLGWQLAYSKKLGLQYEKEDKHE